MAAIFTLKHSFLSRKHHSLILLFFCSCVAIQNPEGGPPDKTPPKLKRTFPKNETVSFQGKKIAFTFNKDIDVQNIYKNLLITPNLEPKKDKPIYQYSIKGKTLELKFNSPLKENTTYTINCNYAIQDRHERLSPTDAILTFSTGLFIDQIAIQGIVKDLLTNQPVKDVNIYLYKTANDSKTFQEDAIPDYYAKSNDNGNFIINHISSGKYYIRATTGEGLKSSINYEKDQYGFLPDAIDLSDSKKDIIIPLVKSDVRDLKLLRKVPYKGFFELIFNKEIETYTIQALQTINHSKKALYSHKIAPNTIRIYNTIGLRAGENLKIQLIAKDNLNNTYKKNLFIYFKDGKLDLQKEKLIHTFTPRPIDSILPTFSESITFNKPIQTINQELIYFEGANKTKISINQEELVWDANKTQLTITKNFSKKECLLFKIQKQDNHQKQFITLIIDQNACIAFDKEANNQIARDYTLRNTEETGTLSGNIKTSTSNFIIELLNSNYEVVDSIQNKKDYKFSMVVPGTYYIRVLVLNKEEKKWTPGNIRKNIAPNPVIFYKEAIEVIAKWDITGIDFTF